MSEFDSQIKTRLSELGEHVQAYAVADAVFWWSGYAAACGGFAALGCLLELPYIETVKVLIIALAALGISRMANKRKTVHAVARYAAEDALIAFIKDSIHEKDY